MTEAPERPPLAFESLEDVLAALRSSGHRVSAPARHVLHALFEADGPRSAERLADGVDLASVYRNLDRLERLGVVRHVHLGHGPGLYALVRGQDREYVVCDRCGAVREIDPGRLDGVREQLRRAVGHHARFSHFALHGHCDDCHRVLSTGGRPVSGHDHEHSHTHEHEHDGVTHSHPHATHDHEHTEHEHEHTHGDRVHSHPHVHEAGLEHEHDHEHDENG